MTDIVDRLRALEIDVAANNVVADGEPAYVICKDAADEIEKLRAQVVSLQSSLDAAPEHTRLGKKKTPDALEKP
jgi:outer membrane protein TolC